MLSARLELSKGRVNKAIVLSHDYPALLRARRRREMDRRTGGSTNAIAGDQRVFMAKPRRGMGSRPPSGAASPT